MPNRSAMTMDGSLVTVSMLAAFRALRTGFGQSAAHPGGGTGGVVDLGLDERVRGHPQLLSGPVRRGHSSLRL